MTTAKINDSILYAKQERISIQLMQVDLDVRLRLHVLNSRFESGRILR